jgi:hypothetical protein
MDRLRWVVPLSLLSCLLSCLLCSAAAAAQDPQPVPETAAPKPAGPAPAKTEAAPAKADAPEKAEPPAKGKAAKGKPAKGAKGAARQTPAAKPAAEPKPEPAKPDTAPAADAKPDAAKPDAVKPDAAKPDAAKVEPAKAEAAKDAPKAEAPAAAFKPDAPPAKAEPAPAPATAQAPAPAAAAPASNEPPWWAVQLKPGFKLTVGLSGGLTTLNQPGYGQYYPDTHTFETWDHEYKRSFGLNLEVGWRFGAVSLGVQAQVFEAGSPSIFGTDLLVPVTVGPRLEVAVGMLRFGASPVLALNPKSPYLAMDGGFNVDAGVQLGHFGVRLMGGELFGMGTYVTPSNQLVQTTHNTKLIPIHLSVLWDY